MNVNHLSDDARNLNWLVANFTSKVPGVANTLVLSADGLPLALSDNLDRDAADQLSAIASGLSSLTQGAARCLAAGAVKQAIVEMEACLLYTSPSPRDGLLSRMPSSA